MKKMEMEKIDLELWYMEVKFLTLIPILHRTGVKLEFDGGKIRDSEKNKRKYSFFVKILDKNKNDKD